MKYIFILLSLFFTAVSQGQIDIINQSLTDSSLNYLYIGVDNRIKVKGSNSEYKLVITGGGGIHSKSGKNEYLVRVNTPTKLCSLFLLKGTQHIFQKSFEVRTLSSPIATLGGFNDTTAKTNILLGNPYISMLMPGCYFRMNYRVTAFQAIMIQHSDSTATTGDGNMLSQEQVELIKTLRTGDKIYFDDIRVISPDGRTGKLPSFRITIE